MFAVRYWHCLDFSSLSSGVSVMSLQRRTLDLSRRLDLANIPVKSMDFEQGSRHAKQRAGFLFTLKMPVAVQSLKSREKRSLSPEADLKREATLIRSVIFKAVVYRSHVPVICVQPRSERT